MVGQRLRRHPLVGRAPDPGSAGERRSPVRVVVRGRDLATLDRLQRLAAATGSMTVADGTRDDLDGDVVVVTLGDEDPSGLDELRRAARDPRRPRTVVVARGTSWFELAFDAGADVWVDASAEDDTLLAAILAPLRPRTRTS